MRGPVKLTFGEAAFDIKPLTIRQTETIEAILTGGAASGTRQAASIIAAALSRDHADVDVGGLEATPRDLSEAVNAILRHGGFIEGRSPGEASADRIAGAPSAPA